MYFTKNDIEHLNSEYGVDSIEIVNRFKIIETKGGDFIPNTNKCFIIFDELTMETHSKYYGRLIAQKALKKLGSEKVKIDKKTDKRTLFGILAQ